MTLSSVSPNRHSRLEWWPLICRRLSRDRETRCVDAAQAPLLGLLVLVTTVVDHPVATQRKAHIAPRPSTSGPVKVGLNLRPTPQPVGDLRGGEAKRYGRPGWPPPVPSWWGEVGSTMSVRAGVLAPSHFSAGAFARGHESCRPSRAPRSRRGRRGATAVRFPPLETCAQGSFSVGRIDTDRVCESGHLGTGRVDGEHRPAVVERWSGGADPGSQLERDVESASGYDLPFGASRL